AAGLAAKEFPHVRIFLLGHEAAAGGIFVGQDDVFEFLRGEDHEVFGEAGKMRGDAREGEQVVDGEVAVANGVDTVRRDAREAELAGYEFAIYAKTVARQRTGAHWAGVG